MATVYSFRALRPRAAEAVCIAAPPYDVVNTAEARALAGDNPLCFLRVSRPEIELPPSLSTSYEFSEAAAALVRGRLDVSGPVTEENLARTLHLRPESVKAALAALEGEGYVLRGRWSGEEAEWC